MSTQPRGIRFRGASGQEKSGGGYSRQSRDRKGALDIEVGDKRCLTVAAPIMAPTTRDLPPGPAVIYTKYLN